MTQNVDDFFTCQSDDYISERNDDNDEVEDQIEVLGEEMIMVLLSSLSNKRKVADSQTDLPKPKKKRKKNGS